MASSIGVEVSQDYIRTMHSEWYKYYDRRDVYVIKYFCNLGFFRGRKTGQVGSDQCQHCGLMANSRAHAVDRCVHYDDLRLVAYRKLDLMGLCRDPHSVASLSVLLDQMYFQPSDVRKQRTKEMQYLKWFITQIYIGQDKDKAMTGLAKEPSRLIAV